MSSRTHAFVSNLLVVFFLLGLYTTAYAEDWVQAWSYDNPDDGKAASVAIDRDSFKLTPNGNATYKLRLTVNGNTVFILTCEASPQKRFRGLKREYPDGKVEFPGDGGKLWQWKDFVGRTGDREYAIIAPFFTGESNGKQGNRWAKVAVDVDSNVYFYDTQSATWLNDGSCRVWIVKVGPGEEPESQNSEAYVYYPDRTISSTRSVAHTAIRPDTIQERIWQVLFKR